MFTGIIEEIGKVGRIEKRSGYQRTTIQAKKVLAGVKIGDSISLDGACHTVVAFDEDTFAVESVDETLRRTTLGHRQVGHLLNLERSLKLGDRLDGHLVSGHVDGVGTISRRSDFSDNVLFEVENPVALSPYFAEKGSVTVDGISLTVISVTSCSFSVTIIPHTLTVTTLAHKRTGERVNLEVDLVARYLERLTQFPYHGRLTESKIKEMGFE
ncbi:MAG: riboflavin synthase [bacterium]|jgi:riboflavin synthase|nr:riboflavin synthase [bacterium]